MKKRERIGSAVLAAVLLLGSCLPMTGCRKKATETAGKATESRTQESEEEKKEEGGEKTPEKEPEKQTYHFVDVKGESYEAELLTELAPCAYDYDRLVQKNGYTYYTDADGNTASRLGIDVSEFQGQVDWTAVKNAGIEFVIIRLGYRGYGESGTLVLDPSFEQNIQGASAAGLDVGVYFFSQAITAAEAEEEADFVLQHIAPYQAKGPVVFDTEEIKYDVARTDNLTGTQFTDFCIAFCEKIKGAGYTPMIYANMKWMAFKLELARLEAYEKWYADYEPAPQSPYAISIWQYSETGTVPGITGNVDLNVWFQNKK